MTEMLEIGTMTGFAMSAEIAWPMLSLSALLLSVFAMRARPLAFRHMPARAMRATSAETSPLPAAQPLDIANQMDRLFAIIADCERVASHAARCHSTARAELDQAEYHLTTLVDSDPFLRRISARAGLASPLTPRQEVTAKPALRLAA